MPYTLFVECPKCGTQAFSIEEIESKFGFRTVNGKKIPQSYCTKCRHIQKELKENKYED